MIIGRGQIATSFNNTDLEDYIIFASGVSDSNCTNNDIFLREYNLIMQVLEDNPKKTLVYFSSCALSAKNYELNEYYLHKMHMEKVIQESGVSYYIFRLPQVFGQLNNKTTLLNFLYNKIQSEENFFLFDNAFRYVIDVADIAPIVYTIISHQKPNVIIDIANPYKYKVTEIVNILESFCGKKAHYQLIQKTDEYTLDLDFITNFVIQHNLNLGFGELYLKSKLTKYINPR